MAALLAHRSVLIAGALLLCLTTATCGSQPEPGTGALRVEVGYADTRTPAVPGSFPAPWAGSRGVRFVGRGPGYAGGALRIENRSGRDLHLDRVAVTVAGARWSPWPADQLIPPHGSLVLTQTAPGNLATAARAGACAAPSNAVPRIVLTSAGRQLELRDLGRVLTNGGRDVAGCAGGNASHQWAAIGTVPAAEEVREAGWRATAAAAFLFLVGLALLAAAILSIGRLINPSPAAMRSIRTRMRLP